MKKNKKIRISIFRPNGDLVRRFKSIHSFLKSIKAPYKFHSSELRNLNRGVLIWRNGYIIGASKKYRNTYVNPLWCGYFRRRNNEAKRQNMLRLKEFNNYHQLIVVVDNNLKIIRYHRGTIESLSKKMKVSVGTIKASLHRSGKRFIDNGTGANAVYFVYLQDLPIFIKNAELACRL